MAGKSHEGVRRERGGVGRARRVSHQRFELEQGTEEGTMSDDDVTFLAAAILLSQMLGGSSSEPAPAEIARAAANAEKLREEVRRRAKKRVDEGASVLVEASK